MNNVIKRIEIDLYSPTSYEVVKAQQGDNNSRIIEFALYDQGNPYTIPDNVSIKMEGHRSDNSSFIKDCTIADNVITVILDSDILCEAGTVEAKIAMYDLLTDSILSTIPFKIYVQKNPCDKNKLEAEKKSIIDWLILNLEKVKDSLFKHKENKNNPHEVTKAQIGLKNVDNTSDANKPVSTTQQAALDKKANIESPILTGTPKAPTAFIDDDSSQIATTAFTQAAVANHNTSTSAHSDIRDLISGLTKRLNALADSDDTTLDQLSEIVAYIKSNRSLIENITTNKVNVSDIIDNLTSTTTNKPLSANQGKVLNDLITSLTAIVDNKVDKVEGKGLSTNDYTDEEKNKVSSIFSGSVTGLKGNAETEYRHGDVNITPADIGAFPLTGNAIVTGEAAFKSGIVQSHIISSRSEAGFIKACRFKISAPYANQPIKFDLIERGHIGTIYICFISTYVENTNLEKFEYYGVLDGIPYLHKVDNGIWDLYVVASSWYSGTITNLHFGKHQTERMSIDYKNEFVTSLPDGGTYASLMTYNVRAKGADTADLSLRLARNGDPKTPMTFNWQEEKKQPTWLWGGSDGTNMYVYSPSNIACGKAFSDASGNVITDTYALKKMYTYDGNGSRILNPDGSGFLWHPYSNQFYLGVWNEIDGVKGFGGIECTVYGKGATYCNIIPYTNNTTLLGDSSRKWKEIYAMTSTIITSDKNQKKDIKDLDETKTIDFIMCLKPKSFKFINGDSGRTHTGLIAQDVEELLENLNMSTLDFAGFIKSPKTRTVEKEIEQEIERDGEIVIEKSIVSEEEIIEGEYIYGLRYEEFISPLIKVVQIQQGKISLANEKICMLESENAELKSKIERIESTLKVIQNNLNL